MSPCPGHHRVDYDADPPVLPPNGHPVWCSGHRSRILGALEELPTWAALLHAELGRRTDTLTERRVTKSDGGPSPSASVDTLDELAQWVHEWVTVVCEHYGFAGPVIDTAAGTPHLVAALQAGTRYLDGISDKWLDDEDFTPELGREACRLEGRVIRWLRRDDPIEKLHAPCPGCDVPALMRRNGASYVVCAACGLSWSEEDYARLVRILLS